MKGNKKLFTVLNSQLADELTAINQYMVHSEMGENWGYGKLLAAIRKQAMEEMQHAELSMERNVFFEGASTVSLLNSLKIGKTASEVMSENGDELNKPIIQL